MKTTTKALPAFDFWKDNKTTEHFQLSATELALKFNRWKAQVLSNPERGQQWYEYYYGEKAIRCFITDKESDAGLQSVFEQKQFDAIYITLKKHF